MHDVIMVQASANDLLKGLRSIGQSDLVNGFPRIECEGKVGNGKSSLCVWAGSEIVLIFPDKWSESMRKTYLALASCQSSRHYVSTYVLSEWTEESHREVRESGMKLVEEGVVECSGNHDRWRYVFSTMRRLLLTCYRYLCSVK
jgi:hypothetical protein